MKKCLNKIPKNKFGATDATNLAIAVGQQGMQTAQNFQDVKQNGSTTGSTVMQGLQGALSGASTGMMVGGPMGAAIGAGAGLLTGFIPGIVGRKGSVDPVTGEVTEGSGIKGRRGPDKNELYARSREIRRNNALREYNTTAAYDWYQENGANGYTLAANGGVIPNALAYVDDGELLRTPDGDIINIPEQGKPTDSNLVSVPEGTQVLSDKLKVPGTKETFAEAGRKLMKKQKYGNNIYAQNSKMLNDRHNQKAYDELLTIQEDMKKKKGIKKSIGKYDDGTKNIRSADDLSWTRDIMPTDWYRSTLSMITPENIQDYNNLQNTYATLGFTNTKPGNIITPSEAVGNYQGAFDNLTDLNAAIGDLYRNNRLTAVGSTGDSPETWRDGLPGTATWLRHLGRNVTPEQLSQIQSSLHPYIEAFINPENGMVNFRRNTRTIAPVNSNEVPYLDLSNLADTSQARTIPRATRNITNSKGNAGNNSRSFNIGDLNPLISGLSSFIANYQNAKDLEPEPVYPRYARAYFSPVEYNIQPQLDAINRTNAIARYNETQLAPRTGANLAFGIQSAVARNRAINEAYNNQRAINNQTRARNAQVATATSQFNAQAQHTADVEYAQNRAQARNLRRQYRSANAAIIPSMLRDIRQNKRDQALLEYMRPFLEYGQSDEAIANLFKGMK